MKAILFRYSSWCLSLFCMLSMLSCVELDVIPTDKYTDAPKQGIPDYSCKEGESL